MRKRLQSGILLVSFLLACVASFAQERTIRGSIKDDNNVPLAGATVSVKGTSRTTQTDANGNFTIAANEGQSLVVSYVGYTTQDFVISNSGPLNLVLRQAQNSLQDVVVVGYGTQRKANLTGAVSTVDVGKTFGSKPLTDPAKALQGVTPGLNIQFGNGGLTAGASINIRGIGSINGASRPLILVDNVETTDLTILNPNDIESISVLKDAASTSIYGARAAFGVVLVKTKSGRKNQKLTVNYNNNFGWSKPTVLPDFANPVDELQALNEAGIRAGTSSPETFGMNLVKLREGIIKWQQQYSGNSGTEMIKGQDWDVDAADGRAYFFRVWDPKKEMLNKYTFSQQHNVSIQGGAEKISYYMSGGFSQDNGIFKQNPDKVDKYNFTLGLNVSPTDFLDLNLKTLNRNFSYDYPYGYQDYWYYFWRWGAYFPYGTYQGNYFRNIPAYLAGASKANVTDNYQRVDIGATLKVNRHINIRADYTIVRDNALRHETGGPIMAWDFWASGAPKVADISSASQNSTTYTSGRLLMNTFNTYATYQNTFAQAHSVKLTAGINAEKDESLNFFATRRGLLDPAQGELGLTSGDQFSGAVTGNGVSGIPGWITNGHGIRAFAGYFGRLNYDYKGKYLLELNGRYDGSSSFPSQDRWAFFPSGSVGYRISEEGFMDNLKPVLSDWKLRASYGELGNQDLGGVYYLRTMNGIGVNWIPSGSSSTAASVSQPLSVATSLEWERVKTLDVGTDIRLFRNHIGITADWYERNTQGMIQPSSVPSTFGTTGPRINAGNFRTRGYEIGIDANYSLSKDLQVYGNLNFWDYKTVFTKWDNPNNSISTAFNYVGKTYGEIWGFETDGYFTSAEDVTKSASQTNLQNGNFVYGSGDIKYKDLNGDGKIDAGKMTLQDHGDLAVIGNTQPRYQYSARLGAIWKSFDADVYIQGVGKRDWWGIGNVIEPLWQATDILYANQLDYWTPQNTDAYYPRPFPNNQTGKIAGLVAGGNNFYPQTKYLLNLAYCRLKNVTVGYTLPNRLLTRYSIQKLRVYFSGQNLAEISNEKAPIDPELTDASSTGGFTGRNWPFSRTYSVGLQLTF